MKPNKKIKVNKDKQKNKADEVDKVDKDDKVNADQVKEIKTKNVYFFSLSFNSFCNL